MPDTRIARRHVMGVAAALAATAVISSTVTAYATAGIGSSGPNLQAAENVLKKGLILRQVVVVPADPRPGKRPAKVELDEMVERGNNELASTFGLQALEEGRDNLARAASMQEQGAVQALGGGADAFEVTPQVLDNETVLFRGSYRAWSKVAPLEGASVAPSTPSNVIDFNATVSKGEAGWRITAFSWDFRPGYGP